MIDAVTIDRKTLRRKARVIVGMQIDMRGSRRECPKNQWNAATLYVASCSLLVVQRVAGLAPAAPELFRG